MNKILIGVAVVIVIGLGIYFATKPKGTEESVQTNTNQEQTQNTENLNEETEESPTSLKDLMAGSTRTCTYTDGQNTGTVYAANGKARLDMTSVTNGVSSSMHAVIDSNNYYGWIEGQPSGFKFSIAQSSTGSAGPNQNVDINKQIDYDCSSWNVDASKFNLPSGVTFTDYSSLQMGR
jgi:hypothetical protein